MGVVAARGAWMGVPKQVSERGKAWASSLWERLGKRRGEGALRYQRASRYRPSQPLDRQPKCSAKGSSPASYGVLSLETRST